MRVSFFKQHTVFIILGVVLGLTTTVLVTSANTGEPIDVVLDAMEVTEVVSPKEVESPDPAIPESEAGEGEILKEETDLVEPEVRLETEETDLVDSVEPALEVEGEDQTTIPETTEDTLELTPEAETITAPVPTEPATPDQELPPPSAEDPLPLPTSSPTSEIKLLPEPTDDSWLPLHPRDCIHGPAREQFASPGECLRLIRR